MCVIIKIIQLLKYKITKNAFSVERNNYQKTVKTLSNLLFIKKKKRYEFIFLHQHIAALNLSVLAWLSCTQLMQHLMVQSPSFPVTLGQFFKRKNIINEASD